MANGLISMGTGWAVVSLVLSVLPATAADCGPTAYDCALYYVQHKDFASAIHSLQEVLENQPHSLKALNLLGIALTGAGQVEKANSEFKKALELNPRFYPAIENLAINELALGRTAEAKIHFERVLSGAPQDETAHLFLAEIYFRDKQCASALDHYDKVRVRIVNNPESILHYGQCALEKRSKQAAVNMLDLLPVTDAESQFQAGLMLGRAEAYADAAKHFALARQRSFPDSYTASFNLTLMLIKAANYPAAIRVAKQEFARGGKHAELYNLAAEAYLKNNQVNEAYASLRRAIQLEPEQENNYTDLAAICLDYANYDLGLEITEIGLRHLPNSYLLYTQRGVMHAMKGQLVEAEKDFTQAIKLVPQKTLPYFALGKLWMQMGKIQQAIDMLRERVRLNPDDFLLEYELGEVLVRSGPEPNSPVEREATEAFERSIRLNPNFGYPRTELGKILFKRGELPRATKELERAAALDPTDATPAYLLAQAYRKQGDFARAEELLARVSKLHSQEREGSDDKSRLFRIVREGTAPFSERQTQP